MAHPKYTLEFQTALYWSKVDKSAGPDACWPWTGCMVGGTGYGKFWWTSAIWRAHRLAYRLTFGPFPLKLKVLHTCDYPACCNPAHLFLGTDLDNMRDKKHKNRQAKGETQGSHKLTREQVIEIRCRYATGPETQRQIAEQFGISQARVSSIVNRRAWAHIP